MRNHEDDNPAPQPEGDANDDNVTTTPSQNTPSIAASSSSNINATSTSGRWSPDEIQLLLDYVEANCVFTAAKGINLKKSEFKGAHDVVKTKTATQCHYKWGHVSVFVIADR